jgi:hypothetical protein
MRCNMESSLMFFTAITLVAALVMPLRPAAQDNQAAAGQNPVPLINQPLVPDAVAPGATGFTLTVNGSGFVSGSVVDWNGSPLVTTFVNSSQLTASVPAADIAAASTASVTVFSPAPGGGLSNTGFVEVTKATAAIFLTRTDYSDTDNPCGVAVGDFNGDGKLDLAVTDGGASVVSIFLGNGDGTFRSDIDYGTGTGPIAVAVGDFNGDGKLDLATADYGSLNPSISILLGNGDGTFRGHTDYPTPYSPYSVVVGDFNGDGKLDLALGNEDVYSPVNTISVLLGNGDGTFQSAVEYVAGNNPNSVAVGDFNHDGKLDLVVTNVNDSTVSILLGNGDGTFETHVDYQAAGAIGVVVGDLNHDDNLDLAVAGANTVGILLGNGDGTFQSQVDYGTGNLPFAVTAADFNGDGNLDLALPNDVDNTVSVLLGNGDGTFQTHGDYPVLLSPNSLAAGDFNQDGRLDIAVVSLLNTSVLLQDSFVLSPPSVNFGVQVVGTQSPGQSVQLINYGSVAVTIGSIAITGTNAGDFSLKNNCGLSLPPGASCRLRAAFKPTQLGPRTASVTITDNAQGSPQTAPLSGTGVTSGPNVTLSSTSLTFATQLLFTTSGSQPITLSNYGNATLDITGITSSGDFSESSTCGSTLAPAASCSIFVTFTPTQPGSRTGVLSITDNAPGSPQTVGLTGTGTEVALVPTSLNFPPVAIGQSASLSTILTNVGSMTLTITGITIGGTDPIDFSQSNSCDGSVKAGKSCTITVTFRPIDVGLRTADLSVSDNGGASPQQVSLSGTAECGGSCFTGCKGTGCKCLVGRCLVLGSADFLQQSPFEPNGASSAACGNNTAAKSAAPSASTISR